MTFSKFFQSKNAIASLRNKCLFGPKLLYSLLRLARTVTMYIWDLRIKKKSEIKHMTLADVDILSFM